MNQSENRIFFFEVVLVHFPALNTYLNQASLNLAKTIDAWQETLHDVTTDEALSVIHRWTRDELPRPAYLELADFALHLRGVVLRDRAERKRDFIKEMHKDKNKEPDPKDYSKVSFRKYVNMALALGAKRKANEIDDSQFQAGIKQVLEDHDRAFKQTRYGNG